MLKNALFISRIFMILSFTTAFAVGLYSNDSKLIFSVSSIAVFYFIIMFPFSSYKPTGFYNHFQHLSEKLFSYILFLSSSFVMLFFAYA